VAASAPPAQGQAPPQAATPPPLDQGRVQSLRAAAEQNPNDAEPRVQLGNAFFDAERYGEAISWYEAAMILTPRDANVSTDLGVAYYYTSQSDRAIQQFQHSLSIDPKHTKTLLNLGIVKAFGKQDLDGAAEAWKQVIELAPDSPEGQAARRALDGLQKAHPSSGSASGSG
jgi:cytochrome c-type biogenesis protein CcmH/NrfG